VAPLLRDGDQTTPNFGGHSPINGAPQICFRFRHAAPFLNEDDSVKLGSKIETDFGLFHLLKKLGRDG